MNALVYELPLVFTSGVLGSAHCIGMCGPISVAMSLGTDHVRAAVLRQLLWSCGRVFTYAFLGMVAGFAGGRLTRSEIVTSQETAVLLQATFAVVAGLLLVVQGLIATGWFKRRRIRPGSCTTAATFGRLIQGGSAAAVFLAGIFTGFLPCGLVYSFLALAAATTSFWKGPLLMAAFGLGTVPVMLLTGTGLSLTSLTRRQRLLKLAAICVIVTGALTVGRGIAFAAKTPAESPSAACPLCDDTAPMNQ